MSNHTPEPWRVGRDGSVVSDTPVPGMGGSDAVEYYGGHLIGESIIEANARRIAACVNACAGISTDRLEKAKQLELEPEAFPVWKAYCEKKMQLEDVTEQRDALLAALQGMIDITNDSQGVAGYHLNGEVADWGEFKEWQAACDAITAAKGSAS